MKDYMEELEAYQDLDHSHIIRLFDFSANAVFKDSDSKKRFNCCYLVFEYVVGGELFDLVIKKSQIPDSGVRLIFSQLMDALEYVHGKGIAHRDLKLENILMDKDFKVKIADFGTAKMVDKQGLLKTCTGTPGYMAPEVSLGQAYDPFKADLFSMGCVLFMMVTRIPVTEGKCEERDPVFKMIAKSKFD